jgi:hypothetical protein
MKSLRSAVLTATLLGLALIAGPPVAHLFAQTAMTVTTLGAALAAPVQGAPNNVVTLASGTGVSVGVGMAIDNEYFVVTGAQPQTTRWTVARGQSGTAAGAHANGAGVIIGAANNFGFNQNGGPVGPCTSTLVQALPYVTVSNGGVNIYTCPAVTTLTGSTAATWDWVQASGYGRPNPARYTGWTYATAGALRIQNGIQYIGSGGALSMTLADPTLWQNGTTMVLQAITAQAHVVTYTAGFWGGTNTSSDVATFGGAIGDVLVIEAVNGAWRVLAQKNVTIA